MALTSLQVIISGGHSVSALDSLHNRQHPDTERACQGRHSQLYDHPGAAQHETGRPAELKLNSTGTYKDNQLEYGWQDTGNSEKLSAGSRVAQTAK